jgi:hypothetical protein
MLRASWVSQWCVDGVIHLVFSGLSGDESGAGSLNAVLDQMTKPLSNHPSQEDGILSQLCDMSSITTCMTTQAARRSREGPGNEAGRHAG